MKTFSFDRSIAFTAFRKLRALRLPTLLAALLFITLPLHAGQPASDAAKQKLSFVLPDLDFKDKPLPEAVSALDKIVNATPDKEKGVMFIIMTNGTIPNITLMMKSPTLEQALTEIAKQAHLKIATEGHAISLIPES